MYSEIAFKNKKRKKRKKEKKVTEQEPKQPRMKRSLFKEESKLTRCSCRRRLAMFPLLFFSVLCSFFNNDLLPPCSESPAEQLALPCRTPAPGPALHLPLEVVALRRRMSRS